MVNLFSPWLAYAKKLCISVLEDIHIALSIQVVFLAVEPVNLASLFFANLQHTQVVEGTAVKTVLALAFQLLVFGFLLQVQVLVLDLVVLFFHFVDLLLVSVDLKLQFLLEILLTMLLVTRCVIILHLKGFLK